MPHLRELNNHNTAKKNGYLYADTILILLAPPNYLNVLTKKHLGLSALRMIDGRISPVSSVVWRTHRPQSSASASLYPANRNEFAKNVGVSTRNFKTFL